MGLTIEGPAFAFVGEETCWRAAPDLASDAVLTVIWADGERTTLDPGLSEACHTYALPGPLVIGMTSVRGAREESATLLVHVVFRPRDIPVTRSSSIAVDGDSVWTVEPDADLVVQLDATTGEVRRRTDVGDRPRTLAIAGDQVFVACQGDGTLHVLGPGEGHAIVELGAGSGAFGVVVDPRGGYVFVSLLWSGALVSVALEDLTVRARIDVGPDPRALAMRDDGLLVITRWRADQDAAAVVLVDAADPNAPTLSDTTRLLREEGRDSDTDNDGVLSFLDGLALSPDGGRVLVGGLKANIVTGLARTGMPLTSQTTARGALAEVMLGERDEPGIDSFRRPLDDLDAISALAFSRMGEQVYLAVPGAEVVIVLDAFSLDTVGSIDDVGHAVDGLALDGSGETLFVHAALSREVRAYDVRSLRTEPTARWTQSTITSEPFTPEVLAGAILFGRSRDARMSRTRYLSCASCHQDGESDGLTWDFTQRGEGLRNTISLRGRGGLLDGPLHWSANFDEVQDFEQDIRTWQGGSGFLDDADFHPGMPLLAPLAGLSPELDALAAYLVSLDDFGVSPDRSEDPAWQAARSRGEAIFMETDRGCATCHAPPRYTDSAFVTPGVPRLHDVGTLRPSSGSRLGAPLTGIDTPTLRGLWSSAPYLHDGSAETLDAVLTRDTGDLHGRTSDLSEAQRADLITFLRSLDDLAP
jgi:DNA-binding beta-propeller fold protein YncE